jgi:hypothetical protein
MDGRHEILIGNGGDCLREREPSLLALLEEIPGSDLVGQVDREHDDDPSPALGVDPVEACAPPPRSSPEEFVPELGQVTSLSGRGYFLERRGELRGAKVRVVLVCARLHQLVERESRVDEVE